MLMRVMLALSVCFLTLTSAQALCSKWGNPQKVGALDSNIIDESSGMEISTKGSQRIFHINDSGDGPYFYVTNMEGENTRPISIQDFSPVDVEDLTLGPCGGEKADEKSCLVIGDIGDNDRARSHVSLVFVEQRESFAQSVSPHKILRVRYPDGAHNAEGMAMNAAGDVFILTKEKHFSSQQAAEAELFVLRREVIQRASSQTLEFEHVGSLDLPELLGDKFSANGKIVTAFDIAPDNSRALILTYETALEVKWNKLTPSAGMNVNDWQIERDFNRIQLKNLPQQEAAFLTSEGMFYSTEYKEDEGEASFYFVPCSGTIVD